MAGWLAPGNRYSLWLVAGAQLLSITSQVLSIRDNGSTPFGLVLLTVSILLLLISVAWLIAIYRAKRNFPAEESGAR